MAFGNTAAFSVVTERGISVARHSPIKHSATHSTEQHTPQQCTLHTSAVGINLGGKELRN